MKKTVGIIAGTALAIGLIAGTATAASAEPLDGGVTIGDGQQSSIGMRIGGSFWQWGVGSRDTWSNYFHENQCHGATAVGIKSKRVSNVRGGLYAMATTPKKSSGNQAFWHRC
ncbi:lactococcin 972 family bacteriocin [Curtobacterium sp. PhB130]|uniref:lactococcin 972 family bacteriocin n=1 Tax=Curtobacterium sp. PhB130 TaxID=2485178 RepID=UPI000F4C128F|nr:lactococcin 972 family bacteriocin [Curtobacterium sp. PhB130]ROS74051.1 lactococcin 972 family bacteriocin [Curtobacterium sp. PhB130]